MTRGSCDVDEVVTTDDVTAPEDDVVAVSVVEVVDDVADRFGGALVLPGTSVKSARPPNGSVMKDVLSKRRELVAASNVWTSIEKVVLALHGSKNVSWQRSISQGGSQSGGGVFGRKCNLRKIEK